MVIEMDFSLNGKMLKIEIIHKKNKNLYMRFQDEKTLIITCSPFVKEKEIVHIIQKNQKTLEKMHFKKIQEVNKEQYFYYLGKPYNKIFDGLTKLPIFTQDAIRVKDEKTLKKFYLQECRRIFEAELERILPCFQNIPAFSLKMRQMKTRWGVNNYGSQTITLNTELLKKELDLIDYVIIHELCHFYEPNHSPNFWKHVEEYYPKYKEARKRLRG